MKSHWNQEIADRCGEDDAVGLRVYSSRLLGGDSSLVLHGGGNTSVKGEYTDVFGASIEALFVKGSGWDLRTIESPGFPATDLERLRRLGELGALGDAEMMRQLRLALLDPEAPTPSVEAILHALIPHRYVDHTHADAVVTISNTPGGEQRLRELYGDEVLILPYIMPGFILARQVAAATAGLDWTNLRGIVLMHHGIFTFADAARASYETMIELVSRAEDFLQQHSGASQKEAETRLTSADLLALSRLRRAAGDLFGGAVVVQCDTSLRAAGFAKLSNAGELAQRGPLTPDHTIHAKAFAAVLDDDPMEGLTAFARLYRQYFDAHCGDEHRMLDAMPRYGVWKNKGLVYFAGNRKRLQIVADITAHTIKAIQQAEALGGWETLPRDELFAVEYWELEQAKLRRGGSRAEFEGRVALVSGAASGIGKACVEALVSKGAIVIALDIAEQHLSDRLTPSVLPIVCDVTQTAQVNSALQQAVQQFGGLDMLVSNAGSFPQSAALEELDDEVWQLSLDLNLTAHMRLLRACIPFLRNGFDPAVVVVGSKNVPAPGPGAAAYSVAKAGLNQVARIAALELGESGIRVNSVHPDGIYDTGIWSDDVLAERAARYGVSVEEYRSANVLGTELSSTNVADTIVSLLGDSFTGTTGAQIAVDGGNDRVI